MKTPQQTVVQRPRAPQETAPDGDSADVLRYEFSKGYLPLANPKSAEPDETDIK